jgi:hypothetical protein
MKKQRKNYSFDAVVKSFMQYYQLPTKHDIEKLDEKLDRLEQAIYSLERVTPPRREGETLYACKKGKNRFRFTNERRGHGFWHNKKASQRY